MSQMKVLSTLSYLFLIGLGSITLFLAWKMVLNYRLKYLFYIFLFLVFIHSYNFMDIIGSYFILGVLKQQITSIYTSTILNLVLSVLSIPFFVMACYFFILMVREIRRIIISTKIKIGFWLFQTALLLSFAFFTNKFILTKGVQFIRSSSHILLIFFSINHLILFILILRNLRKPEQSIRQKPIQGIKRFLTIYLIIIPLHFASMYLPFPQTLGCYGHPLIVFSIHLPAILYLFKYLKKYYRENPLQEIDKADLWNLFDKNQISDREQEIIHLVLQGKNNRIISDELFISLKTVKAHLYNIYRKLNINSRWQLINLIQNIVSKEKDHELVKENGGT